MKIKLLFIALALSSFAFAQRTNKFGQLEDKWPTPSPYRNAAGAPGHAYYQNEANYEIDVILDEPGQNIKGTEKIT